MNWSFLMTQAAVIILFALAVVLVAGLVAKLLRARQIAKANRRADAYLPKLKEMNARTVERKRRLIEQLRLCSPMIKINGKREAACWNSVLNALAKCRPMEDDKLEGIAVLFASLEESFGREITPDHLEKEAALMDRAERSWRKLLLLIGDPKRVLANLDNKPQA
jgi:hypothetical protein